MQIFVEKPDGKTISLNVEESRETICSVKRKLEDKEGIPGDVVPTLTYAGEELGNTTIDDVKAKIYEVLGIPPDMFDGKEVDGNERLLENHIGMDSTLLLATPIGAPTKDTPNIIDTTDAEDTARNKEKELEATISRLTYTNKLFSACYESEIATLKTENKKTKQELMVARSKEKEQEATISRVTYKGKVFSGQCATYENQVLALEAENMKTKEELTIAAQKYYSGGRAAGYAQGLKEGKAKRLKNIDFIGHMINASMQYFNYGFDSCQKQAEQKGFVGQLDKESALKDAPGLEAWK